mmetsp:Transcript_5367/g.10344  ORF Transcript_5367/g.10344 Transcript_5367/m.10344 type:complete len:88 (+) Transcript_5367:969-1232(+)
MLVKSSFLRAEVWLSGEEHSELSLLLVEENERKFFEIGNAGEISRDKVANWMEKATEGSPWKKTIAKASKRRRSGYNMVLIFLLCFT